MIYFIQPLFANIAIIFSVIHLFNMLFPLHRQLELNVKNRVILGIISGISSLLCMSYPIETLHDSHFDLRNVPILIITMYAGYLPGIICSFVVMLARMWLGGEFTWLGLVLALLTLLAGAVYRKFFKYEKEKWRPAISLAIIYSFVYIFLIYKYLNFLPEKFYWIYFTSFYIAFFSCIFLLERLFKINMQLRETVYLDKLSVAGQMAAAIAHEVRNPLTTVRGLIQLLGDDTTDEKLKEFSPLILDELDRTNKIITDYLTMAKPANPDIQSIDIHQVLQDVVSLLAPYGSMHNVDIHYQPVSGYFVCGDKQQLKQCMLNLIKNGIEAADKQGRISIYSYEVTKKKITLAIEDNGKGMNREQLEQIGLPFYTTKSKGTGLGTMVTYRLIQDMGGTVRYKSEQGSGTRVLVTLPVCTK